jgi:hypothetical protein
MEGINMNTEEIKELNVIIARYVDSKGGNIQEILAFLISSLITLLKIRNVSQEEFNEILDKMRYAYSEEFTTEK